MISESDYIEAIVDEAAKTITVTPLKKTPSTQTITVTQSEDATYSVGKATFTVDISDSTPVGDVSEDVIDFTAQSYTNQQTIEKFEADGCTISFDKGTNSNAPKYFTTGTAIRAYGGNTFTVTSTCGKSISEIIITFGNSDGSNEITANVGTYSDGTWTGDAESVTFTIGGTSGNRRIAGIKVTYADAGDTRVATTTTFPQASYAIELGDEFTAPTATVKVGEEEVTGAEVTYSGDNDALAAVDATTGSLTFVDGATGEINVTATYAGDETNYKGSTGTYILTVTDPNAPGTENKPYTVAEARAAIDAGTGMTGVYAKGIVSEIVTAYNSKYGNITYNISADGTTTADQLQAFRGKSYNGESFTSEDDIQVGDEVVVYGNLKKYGETYEFDTNNQLVSLKRPVVTTPSITIDPATYTMDAKAGGGEIPVVSENLASDPQLAVVFVEADGVTPATYDWITAVINANGNIDGHIDANTGDARTAYFKVSGKDADDNTIYSNLVTINQAAPAAPSITVEKGSIDFVAGGESDRKMSFEYESLGNSPSFEVVFFDELGTTVTTYDWVTTATIENNEKVNLSVAQNDGAARTAYFKVHETATDVYSNLVTINQAAAADPNTIIFDFTTNDWGLPLTSENVSERREFKKDGYTIALTAGGNNKYGFNTDGYLLLGKNGATLEFPIFDFLVDKITIEGNTGASTSVKQAIYMKTYSEGLKQASSTTTGATGTNEYNISWGCQAAGEELLLQVTSAHNTQITRILIHKKETVDVTIGSTGYATLYYGDKNFSYGRKGGVSAYAVNLTNGALKMEAISNQAVIPAGTAMVLEGNPGTHVFEVEDAAFSSIAAEAEVNFTGCDNLLFGFDTPSTTVAPAAGDYLFYLLGVDNGKVGFYWGKAKGAAFTSGAHKAYLAVPTEQASGLRGFSFDGSVVGINTIGVDMPEGNAYDLQGRRVQQLQKNGLYIVDGKKMLAK